MIFLYETHCIEAQHQSLKRSIGMHNMAQFATVEQAGGLILFWDDFVKITVWETQYLYINVDVIGPDDIQWRFTGFYGHPGIEQRHLSWDLMQSLEIGSRVWWLVVGDCNEILQLSEKLGGRVTSLSQIRFFIKLFVLWSDWYGISRRIFHL